MYALIASYSNGNRNMLGLVNSQAEIDSIIDNMCREYGTEALAATGIQFNVELAV